MSAKVQMMKGNKDPNYSFKESEAGSYHLKMICKRLIEKEKRYEDDVHIVKVSVRDFAIYRNPDTKKSLGFDTIEILHDPTIAIPKVGEELAAGKVKPIDTAPPDKSPEAPPETQKPEYSGLGSTELKPTTTEPIKEVISKPKPKRKPKPKSK